MSGCGKKKVRCYRYQIMADPIFLAKWRHKTKKILDGDICGATRVWITCTFAQRNVSVCDHPSIHFCVNAHTHTRTKEPFYICVFSLSMKCRLLYRIYQNYPEYATNLEYSTSKCITGLFW